MARITFRSVWVMGLSHRAGRDAALRLWLRAPASLPADYADRSIKLKLLQRAAMTGRQTRHHRFLLHLHLGQIDRPRRSPRRDRRGGGRLPRPFRDAVRLLRSILGISDLSAQAIIAEIGRFPTAGHLVSWGGLFRRNDESAGKRRSNRLRKGAPWLKTTLVQCAWAATNRRTATCAPSSCDCARVADRKKPSAPSPRPSSPPSGTCRATAPSGTTSGQTTSSDEPQNSRHATSRSRSPSWDSPAHSSHVPGKFLSRPHSALGGKPPISRLTGDNLLGNDISTLRCLEQAIRSDASIRSDIVLRPHPPLRAAQHGAEAGEGEPEGAVPRRVLGVGTRAGLAAAQQAEPRLEAAAGVLQEGVHGAEILFQHLRRDLDLDLRLTLQREALQRAAFLREGEVQPVLLGEQAGHAQARLPRGVAAAGEGIRGRHGAILARWDEAPVNATC
ncbi:MAG: transposase [Acetobacteraceae bacterium]|nr:transposase [Acetobacteraceae bacterium]